MYPGANAITLRGDDLAIDTSSNPALVGASPIVGGAAPRHDRRYESSQCAMAFDAKGDLYVADRGADVVDVFAPGSTTPTATLTGLSFPGCWPLTPTATSSSPTSKKQHGERVWPGSTTPTATLTGLYAPSALAFDARGNLFVANPVLWHRPR